MPWDSKKYARINWKNRPSTATALGATNLNKMDVFLNEVDNELITMDAGKLNVETANGLLKTLEIDVKTGKIKATELGGTEHEWDLNLEKIPVSFSLHEDGTLVMTTDDGTEFEANIADAIRDYVFEDTDTIGFTKTYDEPGQEGNYNNKGTYTVKANLKKGSVKAEHLDPDWRAEVQQFKNDAETAANSSLQYSKDSKRYAVGDESYPESENDNAKKYKELAESYAHGGTGAREEEATDNAKEYARQAEESAKRAAAISEVDIMTPEVAGIGKPDDVTVKVDGEGTISVPKATVDAEGVVKPDGATIGVDDGTLSLIATASQLPAVDTHSLLPEETGITTQKLLDAIADRIVNQLVTNSKLTEMLVGYVTKAMMSNENINDQNKVPTSAFINSLVSKITANETAITALNNDVDYLSVKQGPWTPKLYLGDALLKDLNGGTCIKIGKIAIYEMYSNNLSGLTITTGPISVRNFEGQVLLSGNVYIRSLGGNEYHLPVQPATNPSQCIFRSDYLTSYPQNATFGSLGLISFGFITMPN